MEGSAGGAVVAEVDDVDRARRISVRPGRYFVRGRMPDALLEGQVDAAPGTDVVVRDDGLQRTEYSRLVRKGGSDTRLSRGLEAGYLLRTPMRNTATVCQGGFAGYAVHWSALDLAARVDR